MVNFRHSNLNSRPLPKRNQVSRCNTLIREENEITVRKLKSVSTNLVRETRKSNVVIDLTISRFRIKLATRRGIIDARRFYLSEHGGAERFKKIVLEAAINYLFGFNQMIFTSRLFTEY